jgi:hypothetical protein
MGDMWQKASDLLPPGFDVPQHSRTPKLRSPVSSWDPKTCGAFFATCNPQSSIFHAQAVVHGLSRVASRVGLEKRPVFIGLSRCHGSGPLGTVRAGITKHPPSLKSSFRRRWEASPFAKAATADKMAGQVGAAGEHESCFDNGAYHSIMSYINLMKLFIRKGGLAKFLKLLRISNGLRAGFIKPDQSV